MESIEENGEIPQMSLLLSQAYFLAPQEHMWNAEKKKKVPSHHPSSCKRDKVFLSTWAPPLCLITVSLGVLSLGAKLLQQLFTTSYSEQGRGLCSQLLQNQHQERFRFQEKEGGPDGRRCSVTQSMAEQDLDSCLWPPHHIAPLLSCFREEWGKGGDQ